MKKFRRIQQNLLILGCCLAVMIYFNLKERHSVEATPRFRVVTSTTPAMIEEMAYAIRHKRLVAITGWSPHWMNARLPLKYLKDPQHVFGKTEGIYSVTRRGLGQIYPHLIAFLRQFKWHAANLDQLSLIAYDHNGDYAAAAREWMQKNSALVQKWLHDVPPQRGAKIKLINSGNHNELATNALLKILLEENLGCEVSCVSTTVPIAFEALADGSQDLMVTVWLPNCHKNEFARIRDQVDNIGCNLADATSGIAVPQYAPVDTIADLKRYHQEFGGKIISIEPGQGIIQLAEQAIEVYKLNPPQSAQP